MSDQSAGQFAYEGLDRVIHERGAAGRADIAGRPSQGTGASATFAAMCQLTDGNLSRHLQVLTEAGFAST